MPERLRAHGLEVVDTRDINVLLLGVDERNDSRGRSDTIMLLNYNALRSALHLMSIPRDTRVKLDKYGYQKINAAYAYGGANLAKRTVADLTGLRIDYYLKVNLEGFPRIVDALGGVAIDIATRMSYDDPYQDLHIHFEPGPRHLTGEEALEYVRWRGDAGADLARVERQRQFLVAACRRAISPVGLFRSPLVMHALARCIETDMPALMRPGVAAAVALAYLKGVETVTTPGTTRDIGGASYFLVDPDKLSEIVVSWYASGSESAEAREISFACTMDREEWAKEFKGL